MRERALKRDKAIPTSSKLMTTSRDMSTQIINWECGSCKSQHDQRYNSLFSSYKLPDSVAIIRFPPSQYIVNNDLKLI